MAEDVQVRFHAQMDLGDVVSNVNAIQQSFNKLKLPDKIGDNLNKNITSFMKEYDKYQKKISEGVKTQGDYNQVEKSLNNMRSLYQAIGKDAEKLTRLDMKDMLNLDTAEFRKISTELTNIIKEIGNAKIDTTPFTQAFADIRKVTKSSKITGDNGILSQMIGHINTGQITEAKKELQALEAYAKKVAPRMTAEGKQAPGTLSAEKYQQLTAAINVMSAAFGQADAAMAPLLQRQNELQNELEETKQKAAQGITNEFSKYSQASAEVDRVTDSLKRMHQEEFSFSREVQNIDRQIQSYFGLSQMIRKVGDIAKEAFSTVKDLDKAMTETAVVTNFNVGDMWNMLPTYTEQANQLGSTIKDVYEAATLYYQQGLNTNQAMSLANETLKMARIAGLEAAEATDMMTAALRGFNMEINQMSAQKINDVYSELAAITASDTKEIGSAMERTASIANSANMEFETTSAFLAQMIETTREAPENLGTAMKTIVARFQEMKKDPTKLIDSEGVAMDANKVDTALKSIGVNLMNTKGEFRDLDDVFLDIASRWDSLTQGQQRYIATIAAGSRQQSRFIAMMSNYERTMELVDAAHNSAGASQRQFEKTLDSMEAKLNKLKNAWDQFTMGLMNNQILKTGVDALTGAFTVVNKLIDLLTKPLPDPFGGLAKSALTLVTTLGMLNLGKRAASGLVMGGTAWFKGEDSFSGGFSKGWKGSGQTGFVRGKGNTRESEQQGMRDGQAYGRGWAKAVQAVQTKQQTGKGLFGQTIDQIKKNKASMGSNADTLKALYPHSELSAEAQEIANDFLNMLRTELSNGTISADQLPDLFDSKFSLTQGLSEIFDADNIKQAVEVFEGKELESIGTGFDGMTSHINSAGVALSNFGMILQGTPLEPFGALLTTIGGSLISLSTVLATAKAGFLEQWAAATAAAMGTEAEGVAAMTAAAANGTLTVSSITAAGGMATLAAAIWAALWPLLVIAVAIGALVGAYKLLDAAIVTNKEKLQAAQDAAAAASEAYDSAKQETSELADAIEQVKSNEDAFDNLAVGTAAFNEQLVNANEQIMELIKKYPMLSDYVTTDANGLMHISQAGLEAVKDYQRQRQNNASALSTLQTNDLRAEENRQKVQELRKARAGDTSKDIQEREQEAKLLEQRIDAETQSAKLSAVHTALLGKQLGDQETMAAVLADQYDTRKKMAAVDMDMNEQRQKYADFYGYEYNKSTKKITDNEGNEVDVEDSVIKDAVKDIVVLEDIQVDASSVESAVNSVNRAFNDSIGEGFEGSSHFISDLLSSNLDVNTDLLNQIVENPKQLQDVVNNLSSKEIAAILGVSEETVNSNLSSYQNQLTNKLTQQARNLAKAQANSFGELGVMLAQAQGKSVKDITKNDKAQKALLDEVKSFTSEQRNTLLNVGKSLQENVGSEAVSTFISQMSGIYKSKNQELIDTTQGIVDGINWDSPTDRLRGYNEMINLTANDTNKLSSESVTKINEMGNALKNSTDEANLLGQAFEEFYNSSDWQEMAENMDKFVDSSGKLNASAVLDMADECGSLNRLLDTGAISAGGMATALNALGSNGDLVLSDLNSNVLELISSFAELENVMASAHRTIQNFDAGIDTGEGEDFIADSVKKFNELYNNGEYGNPQAEAYAKLVVGEERWINELQKNQGNLEKTLDAFAPTINQFSEGFYDAWADLANTNKTLNGIKTSWNDDGSIHLDVGDKTTEEVVDYLQEVKGISREMAEMMLTDFENYSGDLKQELQNNDFMAGLKEGKYTEGRETADGKVGITQSELNTLVSATGKSQEEITAAIEKTSGKEVDILKNIDDRGNLSTDYAGLNKMFSESLGLSTQNGWLAGYKQEGVKNGIDVGAGIEAAIARGFTKSQAQGMAYESFKNAQAQGKDYYYKGEKLEADKIKSLDDFANKLAEIDQSAQWTQVGEQIAAGYLSYIKGMENQDKNPDEANKGANTYENGSQKGAGKGYGTTTSTTDWDAANAEHEASKQAAQQKTKEQWSSLWQGIKTALTSGAEEGGRAAQDAAAMNVKSQQDAVNKGIATASANVDTSKSEQAGKQVVEKKSKAYDAGQARGDTRPTTTPTKTTTKTTTTEKEVPKAQETTLTVKTKDSELTKTEAKIKSVINLTKQPATLNVKAKTGASTQTALANINKVKEAAKGSTSIKVSAKVTGQNKVTALRTAINQINDKAVSVDASVSGLGSVQSLKSAIDGLHDKTITITTNKVTKGNATGTNNKISYHHVPQAGSLAKGTKHGRTGPRNNGGLTLTGEEGFEIAWIPQESRSMILGANGPQMVDLPRDVVIYNHEQSKEIMKKRRGIAAGSAASGYKKKGGGSSGGGNSGGGGSGGGGGGNDTSEEAEKVVQKAGTVVVWWLNLARKTEAIQRKVDKNQKTYEKYLKKLTATLHGTGTEGGGDAYISSLRQSISVNQGALDRANKELKVLNQGSVSAAQNSTIKNAQNRVNAAQNKLNKAKTAKQKATAKKELEAAKKNLTTAKKNALNATRNDVDAGGSVADISYEITKKKGKETTTETKEERVDLGGYINWDAASGTYVINQDAINKVAKTNGSKAKAIRDAAEEEINKRLQRKYEAEDAIAKAQEALEQLSEQLYETFFGWETALTRIWNITQKLEAAESGKTRTESFQDMLEAQLNSGKVDFANEDVRKKFMGKYTDNFKRTLEMQTQVISDRMDAIEQSKKDVQDALTSADEQKKIDAARSILGQDQAIKDAAARLGSAQSELSAAYSRVNSAASAQASAQARINAANSIIQSTGKTLNNKKASSSAKKKARDQRYTAFIERDAAQAALAKANADRMVAEASIAGYQAQVNAAQNAYTALKNNTRELTETEKLAYEEQVKRLEEQKKVEQDARNRYMRVKTLSDGTVVVDFNTELLEMDQENGLITQDHAKKIEDYVNKVIETSKTLGDNYEALTQELTNMYNSLAELKDEWAGYGEELKKIQEDASRKEIDALKRLYDAIANALKELLDKVKKSLDARRQTEDNAKVEQDIAKKQQRLAMLQASSSGTNAVEIAQLEQEIANAQQSYERTLEDQLLAKLQEQGDEAAAQRQRQIELLEAGVESINNIEDVNRWMANPIQYYDELHELYLQSKDWDNLTDAEREKVEIDWTTFFNGLATNQERQEKASGKIDALSALTTQSGTTDAIEAVEKSVEALDEQLKAREEIDALAKQTTLQAQQEAVATAQKVAAAQETARNETAAANAAKAQAQAAEYNARVAVGNSPSAVAKTKYADAIRVAHKSKTITAAQLKDIVAMASQAGYSMSKVGSDLAAKDGSGGVTWIEVVRAAKKAGYSKSNVTKWWTSKVAKNAIKNWSQYATGGLADYTGPAWLDGTPSRPELVLNAQDTKNFLALKDVLAHAMGSIDSTSAGYGDMNYEININVDKISNDYDVDKMADRIKKIIVKDSSYRNVTQVRNLR